MKRFLLLCFSFVLVFNVWAQERIVSGKITAAEDGATLPGVNVILKGTTNGTVTDTQGNFRLSVPPDGGILLFSFIGLQTQEVVIGQRSVIDIQMVADVQQLTEVVVTAVGIEADKRELGYSVASVKPDEIVDSKETNFVSALSSKVPGVQVVSSSGSPGASANIRIRGSKSITSGNNPLFIVDGVPLDNNEAGNGTGGVDQSNRMIDLNPNDIASVSILKGPAATALYGLRATNGAVVVTTKSGSRGKQVVTISSGVTVSEVNKLPEMQNTYAQGRPRNFAGYPSTSDGTYQGPETNEPYSWGPKIVDLEFANDIENSSGGRDGYPGYVFDNNGILVAKGTGNGIPARAYDQFDFFKKGITLDNNFSVSGGNNLVNYYLSGGYLTQTGVVPSADFTRKTVKLNLETSLSEKFKVGLMANYVNSGGYRVQRGSNISGVMLGLLRTSPTFDNGNGKKGKDAVEDPSSYRLPDGKQRSYRNGIYDNPYWTAAKNPFEDDVNRYFGNVNFSYLLNDWAKLSYKLGVDQYTDVRDNALDIGSAGQPNGTVINSAERSSDLNSDLLLILSPKISENIDFAATLGHNYFSQSSFTNTQTGIGLGEPGFFNIANASAVTSTQTWNRRRKIAGVFADVKVGFDNMIYLNISGRNDWSSTFEKDNNSFFYPAVSLGFVFTELLNLESSPVLSFGKLRASWGKVGNDAPIFSTATQFPSYTAAGDGFIGGLTSPIFGLPAYERSTVRGNPQLKPEFTSTTEFGAEFKLFNERIDLDVTYYNSLTDDAIINVTVPASTGFSTQLANAASIENKGWEISLGSTAIKTPEFEWGIDLLFNTFTNTVKELAPGVERVFLSGFTSTSSNAIGGQPFGVLFGSRWDRDEQGRIYIGNDGWPIKASTDGPVGNPIPDWTGGVRNTFSWKGFSLSALIDIRQGGDIWAGTQGIIDYFGTSEQSAKDRTIKGHVFQGIRKSDGQVNTTPVDFFPAPNTTGNLWDNNNNALNSIYSVRYEFGGLSEPNVHDASWIRLREVTLRYKLPASLFTGAFIKTVNVSLSGRNLWLKTDFPGIDPETNLTGATNGVGLEYFNMPNTRSYGATVQLTF